MENPQSSPNEFKSIFADKDDINFQASLLSVAINNNVLLSTIIDLFAEMRSSATGESLDEFNDHIQELQKRNYEVASKFIIENKKTPSIKNAGPKGLKGKESAAWSAYEDTKKEVLATSEKEVKTPVAKPGHISDEFMDRLKGE